MTAEPPGTAEERGRRAGPFSRWLALGSFRWGRRWTAWEMRTKGLRRFGPFLFPLTVIATALFMKELLDRFIRLAGYPYYLGMLVLTLIIDLATAGPGPPPTGRSS